MILRWILAGLLAILALGTLATNYIVVIRRLFLKTSESWIPFVGGVVGCIALLITPSQVVRGYWWIPIILDPTYWGIVLTPGLWVWKSLRTKH